MKNDNLRKLLTVVFIFLFESTLFANKLIKKEKKFQRGGRQYIYVSQNTPNYVITEAIKKRFNLAFKISTSQKDWLRKTNIKRGIIP